MKKISNRQVTTLLAKVLKPFVKLHDFAARTDLPDSTHQLIALAPVGAGFVAALGLVATLVAAPALVLPVLAGAAGMLATLAVTGLAANAMIKNVNKHEDVTTVNAAGQTVQGSAYDIAAVMGIENEINALTRRLDNSTDVHAQEALKKKIGAAFAKASPIAARITVVQDPEAAFGETPAYSFGIKRAQTTVQRAAVN
jgi:hypothetical protein